MIQNNSIYNHGKADTITTSRHTVTHTKCIGSCRNILIILLQILQVYAGNCTHVEHIAARGTDHMWNYSPYCRAQDGILKNPIHRLNGTYLTIPIIEHTLTKEIKVENTPRQRSTIYTDLEQNENLSINQHRAIVKQIVYEQNINERKDSTPHDSPNIKPAVYFDVYNWLILKLIGIEKWEHGQNRKRKNVSHWIKWRKHYGLKQNMKWRNKIIYYGDIWDPTKGYPGEGPDDRRGKKQESSTNRGDKRWFNSLKMWGGVPRIHLRAYRT